ncbi:hypothetical protein [Luteolibacter sp. LG18]|uniref:hypothetical protein n=1 Tax=Luteolibacter sp. LG18 TaxID=2819286 RepID=UPI002B305B2E|nr:hypothetical protein llg_05190 [Luteolibacter sp. LG18]
MSVTISLKGASFDRLKWRRNLALFPSPLSSLTTLCLLYYGASSIPLAPEEEDDSEPDGDEFYWLHPKGGIRGITIRPDEDGFSLTLPMAAGRVDWDAAAKLAEIGRQAGAIVHIDGEPFLDGDPARLFAAGWDHDYRALATLLAESDEPEITLPIGNLVNIKITNLDSSPEEFHDSLAARMARYGDATIANQEYVPRSDGQECRAAMVGGSPTLVESDIPAVLVYDNPALTGNEYPLFDGLPIAMSKFCEAMGDRTENLGEWTYVPSFTVSEEADLHARLDQASDSFDSVERAPTPSLMLQESFSLMQRAPVLVFLLMTDTGDTNTTAFHDAVTQVENDHGGGAYMLFSLATVNLQAFLSEAPGSEEEQIELLSKVGAILADYPPLESTQIRESLVHLARTLRDLFDPTRSSTRYNTLLESLQHTLEPAPDGSA